MANAIQTVTGTGAGIQFYSLNHGNRHAAPDAAVPNLTGRFVGKWALVSFRKRQTMQRRFHIATGDIAAISHCHG
jgi:hypothetical protein